MKKLVRDNYRLIIAPEKLQICDDFSVLRNFVLDKIIEESNEVLQSIDNRKQLIQELADLLEIIEFFQFEFLFKSTLLHYKKNNLNVEKLIDALIENVKKIRVSNSEIDQTIDLFNKICGSLKTKPKEILAEKEIKKFNKGGFDLGLILTLD